MTCKFHWRQRKTCPNVVQKGRVDLKTLVARHLTAGVFYDFEYGLLWDVSFGKVKLVLVSIVWAFLCYFDTRFLTAQVGLKLDKARCDSKFLRVLLLPPQSLGSHVCASHLDSESAGNQSQDLCHAILHIFLILLKPIIIVCLSLFYCL